MEGQSREVRNESARKLVREIELHCAACVVTAILVDRKATMQDWPSDSEVILGINLVLDLAKRSRSLTELLRTRNSLLAPWLVDYLNAIRPRLRELDPTVTAEQILLLAKQIEPQFVTAEEAIRTGHAQLNREPKTVEEWIERSAYAHLQMIERLKEREALQRSEFNVEETLDEES